MEANAWRQVVGLAASMVWALHPGMAQAQPLSDQNLVARRDLIDRAQRARAAGDHDLALEHMHRAGQIQMHSSVRCFIAEEQSALGQHIAALVNARQCIHEARLNPRSPNQRAVLANCRYLERTLRRRMSSQASRVGRIVVRVPDPPPGVRVRINGRPLGSAFWGVPYLIAPGSHTVEADAPEHQDFRRDVQLAAGRELDLVLVLEPTPTPPPPPPAAETPAPRPPPPETRPSPRSTDPVARPEPQASRTRRVYSPIGPVIMGIGALSTIVGVVAYHGVAGELHADLLSTCPSACENRPEREAEIRRWDIAGNVLGWGGLGVLAVGGALLFATVRVVNVPSSPVVILDPARGLVGLAGTF